LRLRGETLPLLRLNKMFSTSSQAGKSASEKVVILAVGEKRIALLVDHLIGQESTVVKPLSSYLHHGSNFSGATLGGDGRVRLVLDPAGLLASAESTGTSAVVQ